MSAQLLRELGGEDYTRVSTDYTDSSAEENGSEFLTPKSVLNPRLSVAKILYEYRAIVV